MASWVRADGVEGRGWRGLPPAGSPSRRGVERGDAAVAAACALAGAVHLAAAGHHLHEGGWVGHAFLADAAAFLVLAGALAPGGPRPFRAMARRLAGVLCLATAAAYVLSRTAGLPGGHRHGWDATGMAVTALELVVAAALVLPVASPGRRRRQLIAVLAVVVGAPPAVAVAQSEPVPRPAERVPAGCVAPIRSIELHARELAPAANGDIRLGWGFTPETASIPGPPIEMVEAECLQITVVNHIPAATFEAIRAAYPVPPGEEPTPLGLSLHVHGVKYTTDSDGTVHTGSWVPPGQARTYTWYAAPRTLAGDRVLSPGTAGTWWYHDHVVGTSHGTGGLAAGLFGALVVRRPGDLAPDRHYTVVFGPNQSINLRSFPATFTCDGTGAEAVDPASCFVARQGERVEFSVLNVGDEFHTFHLHGHVWADSRTGMLAHQADTTRLIDAKTIGPSETFGFQVLAGEEVGPGDWMLHCHVQAHSDLGMLTFFRVLDAGGHVAAPSGLTGHLGHGHSPDHSPGHGHGHSQGHSHAGGGH